MLLLLFGSLWEWEWQWRAEYVLLSVTGGSFSSLALLSPCLCERADLKEGVTDEGLRALASAGCGEKLTLLSLRSECCFLLVCDLMVCGRGSGSGRVGCVLL